MFIKLFETRVIIISIFYITTIRVTFSTKCDSLRNVVVEIRDQTGADSNFTLENGCIERLAFDAKIVVKQIIVRGQIIPVLGEDSVRHMSSLEIVAFLGGQMNTLEAGAFRNVPQLKKLQIGYCQLKEIPRGVFDVIPSLQILRIHNNEIDVIADNAFSNLPQLRRIYGSNNNLRKWNRWWFPNSTALEIMDFSFNKIRTLPRRAFMNFTKLKEVYFDYNEISVIQEDAFKGIHNMDYLGLRYNRITELQENIFPNDLTVKTLSINANYLNYLSNEVLKKVSVKIVFLENNPWKCPCLDQIYVWLSKTNGTSRIAEKCTGSNVPVCAFPNVYSETCLESVDKNVTDKFFLALSEHKDFLDKYCARFN